MATATDRVAPSHVAPTLIHSFDIFKDGAIHGDVQLLYLDLLKKTGGLFYTPENGGHWLAMRMSDIRYIMTNPQLFSSRDAPIRPNRPGLRVPLTPQDMDAPEHMQYRLLLMKFMAPKLLKKLEPKARELIKGLISDLDGRSSCEFKADVAVPMPVLLFMTMMEWPLSRFREFAHWVDTVMASTDEAESAKAYMAMSNYLSEMVDERIANPGDDPVSILLKSDIDGAPVTRERVYEMCHLLFLAGLDTVTAAMCFIMNYLAAHPEIQHRLRDNPDDIPKAVEEFMRRFSFVNTPRRVTKDLELGGVALKEGDIVICSLIAASNDPDYATCPEKVDLDRKGAMHVGFNTGPHSCIGAPLARLELRIFLEEWLARMPDIRHAPGFVPHSRGGSTMSLERLDIEWAPVSTPSLAK